MRKFIANELSGWKMWEIAWLLFSTIVITGVSIYCGDTLIGVISAVTGVVNVICTGKGKLSAFIFGLVNSVLYAIISYNAHLYGETMLNAFYYVPMQFVGFYVWSRHMNKETNEVCKRHMTWKGRLLLAALIVLSTYVYGLFLRQLGDALPFIDAFTTASSVITLIISVRMYAEQWIIWFFVDLVTVYMWWCDYRAGSGNMATLLMWVVFLISAVIMLIKWEKDSGELPK